ncbi:MAG TPA: hypothetical protein VH352_14930 [Pseudonocardiaceae bacterium]|nr:hypothetical protein [Pseudonocardiaceae bacterium]
MSNDDDRTFHLPTPDMSVFGDAETAEVPTEPADGGPRGTMRFQQPGSTAPRPPTLAEQRARIQAEEELAQRQAAVDAKAAGRRKVMIGAGVTVGVAALVGAWYLLASPQTVTAQCTVAGTGSDADTVVADQNCDPDYVAAHGGHITNGFVFLPLVGGGFRQYHYYYGGTGAIGQRATGGSFTAPSNATVRTSSGKTIQRGGFGITGKTGGTGGGTGGKVGGGS